jgi:hypothetical protein
VSTTEFEVAGQANQKEGSRMFEGRRDKAVDTTMMRTHSVPNAEHGRSDIPKYSNCSIISKIFLPTLTL